MDRQKLIEKLEKELKATSFKLLKGYNSKLLLKYEQIEKEIEIQKAYLLNE